MKIAHISSILFRFTEKTMLRKDQSQCGFIRTKRQKGKASAPHTGWGLLTHSAEGSYMQLQRGL